MMKRSKVSTTLCHSTMLLLLASLLLTASSSDVLCVAKAARNKHDNRPTFSEQLLVSAVSRLNIASVTVSVRHETMANFQNCSIILTSLPCENIERLVSQEHLHTPLLVVGEEVCNIEARQRVVSWLPHDWTSGVADIIVALQWTDVLLVVDEHISLRQQVSLKSRLASQHIGSCTFSLCPADDYTISEAAAVIRTITSRSVFLLTSPETTHSLLSQLREELASENFKWFVTSPGFDSLSLQLLSSASHNAVFLFPFNHDDRPEVEPVEDMNPCELRFNFKESAVTHLIESLVRIYPGFNFPYKTPNLPLAYSPLEQEKRLSGSSRDYTDYVPEGLALCSSSKLKNKTLVLEGTWTSSSGLQLYNDLSPQTQFRDFWNNNLRVGAVESIPFVRRVKDSKHLADYEGFCIDLMDELAGYYNFTYTIFEPPDKQFGTQDNNGTWNGMISMIVRGEIDLAIGPFTITAERKTVVDFTVPFMEDGGGILTKRATPGLDLMTMFRPFQWKLWLLCAVSIVITGFVLFVITRVHCSHATNDSRRREPIGTLGECLLLVYGAMLKQNAPKHPSSVSGRLVLGSWWVLTILIVSIYTASLAAMLTVTVQGKNIDCIEDLAYSDFTPFTQLGTSWHTLFNMIAHRMHTAQMVTSDEEAFPLVYTGKAAYITDVSTVDFMYKRDCKNLHVAKNIFSASGLGIALPQNARYKEPFDRVIRKLQEVGVLEVWKRRWWRTYSDSCTTESPVKPAKKLGLVNISGLLILYTIMVTMAAIFLMLQCVFQASVRNGHAHCKPNIPRDRARDVPFEKKIQQQEGIQYGDDREKDKSEKKTEISGN